PMQPGERGAHAPRSPDEAALGLLRQTARLALEGSSGPADGPPQPIRAPIPRHALRLLDRLTGILAPFTTIAAFRTALAEARELPAAVSGARRRVHLAFLTVLLSF